MRIAHAHYTNAFPLDGFIAAQIISLLQFADRKAPSADGHPSIGPILLWDIKVDNLLIEADGGIKVDWGSKSEGSDRQFSVYRLRPRARLPA